jgi:electron transfer flavoprotein alpha subunit
MAKVLIVGEVVNGAPREATRELVTVARGLGGEPSSLLLGHGIAAAAEDLAKHGGGKVLVADDRGLEQYTIDAYAAVIRRAIEAEGPRLVLISNTPTGWDVAPKLAAALDAALVTDVFRVEASGNDFLFTRRMFNGKFDAQLRASGALVIATVQPGAVPAYSGGEAGRLEAFVAGALASRTRFVELRTAKAGGHDLTKAEIIVSGGRGLQKPENFDSVLQPLVSALGAQMGASRPVVDAGWKPHEYQVGSSGQIVTPKLYVAVGISGAIQHIVGMKGANYIIAINKDPDAPIFEVADLGIVGDLFEVVPALVRAIQEAKGA